MSIPKLSWDGKVNIVTLAMILGAVLAVGAAQAQLNSQAQQNQDQEVRIRSLETQVSSSLASIEERLKGIDRIERQLDKSQR